MKRASKCPASVVLTKVDEKWWPQNLSSDEVHNHASDRGAILAGIMKKEMFSKVAKHPETKADDAFRDVITEYEERYGEEEQVWDEAVANLPSKEQLARNMRHIRSKEHGPLPKNRNDFDPEAVIKDAVGGHKVIIMDSNKLLGKEFNCKLDDFKKNKTTYDDDLDEFILNEKDTQSSDVGSNIDSEEESLKDGSNEKSNPGLVDYSISSSDESSTVDDNDSDSTKPKRIIAYSTKHLLKLFNQRKSSGDGTFKICPALWKQLYIVMIKFGNSWIPVCYALLPDKCKETYFAAFYMVRKQIQDMKLSFNVQSMRSDFEIGEMKAAAAAWDIVVKGCYYHFTQSGWRFVQNNGMASAYLSDSDQEFKLLVKCILSLPHVPVQDIDETLEMINTRDWSFEESQEKQAFKEKILCYIKDYWVNGVIPPQVWNCFHRKVDMTNNNNESHNNYLANAIKESHPSPATLTVALVKELTLAETKYRRVISGAERVLKKKYLDLNKRRENLKKMYHKMDRFEYLSQIGNIVMHIQLNKGQMSELKNTRQNKSQAPNEERNSVEDSDDSLDSAVSIENEHSDVFNSTGANETLSSEEENHPYVDRIIGKAVPSGKTATEYEAPEYKGKKCLVCKGKFNVKSKYLVCKLCDKLVHVNNKKKCHKMKNFSKDVNFICIRCNRDPEEVTTANQETSKTPSDEAIMNETFIIEKSMNYQDLTIDGFPCDGLVIRNLETSSNVEDPDPAASGDSVEITYDSPGTASDSLETTSEEPSEVSEFDVCTVCSEVFKSKEALSNHIDVRHFDPCPVCEMVFVGSVEKRAHMATHHNDSIASEEFFCMNIERQSTLNGDVPQRKKDLKKKRMGAI